MPVIVDQVFDAQNETSPVFTMIEPARNFGPSSWARMLVSCHRIGGTTSTAIVLERRVGQGPWSTGQTITVGGSAGTVVNNTAELPVPGVHYRVRHNTSGATDDIRVGVAGYFELVE